VYPCVIEVRNIEASHARRELQSTLLFKVLIYPCEARSHVSYIYIIPFSWKVAISPNHPQQAHHQLINIYSGLLLCRGDCSTWPCAAVYVHTIARPSCAYKTLRKQRVTTCGTCSGSSGYTHTVRHGTNFAEMSVNTIYDPEVKPIRNCNRA
jgi:hypothetical protein